MWPVTKRVRVVSGILQKTVEMIVFVSDDMYLLFSDEENKSYQCQVESNLVVSGGTLVFFSSLFR